MKYPISSVFGLAVLASVWLVSSASAVVNIDYVTVGNPGNAADPSTGYGAVSHTYKIGTYEVTNAQYAEFLNAKGASNSNGIFNSSMASYGITQVGSFGSFTYNVTSGFENKPVVYVSLYDAARFTNWLGNGQGSGSMETGAYTLNGAMSGIDTVNPGAAVWIPSEDEWYKAAYYNGGTSTYSLYPNGQNSITAADANYNFSVGAITDVGSYSGAPSSYGTFDQGGNVWEWNNAVVNGWTRGRRGGSWLYGYRGPLDLASSNRGAGDPASEYADIGFRVASVPEPSCLVLTILAGGGLLTRRKR
jgi:formylglycine-generating enzyme required for sulfatase activity